MKTTQEIKTNIKRIENEDNRTSDDTDTTMDDSVDSANTASKMTTNMVSNEAINSFTAHGFEVPDFAGEILKEIDGTYIGWAKAHHGAIPMCWFKNGSVFLSNINFDLTLIKQHWYGYPENFPAMLIRDTEEHMGYIWVDNKEQFIKRHRQGFRLITKAERDRLFCKE